MRHLPFLLLPALLTCGGVALGNDSTGDTARIIVQWRADRLGSAPREQRLREVEKRSGARVQRLRSLGGRMEVLRLDAGDSRARERTLTELRANAAVEFAVPDNRVHAHAVLPNDPLFPQQWYLGSAEVSATRAQGAWDITLGGNAFASQLVVAVIDTGVLSGHPDLGVAASGGKLLPGYDFVSADKANVFATANDGDGWDADPTDPGDFLSPDDLQSELYKGRKCGGGDDEEQPVNSSWHGTRVSGLIAAAADNGQGITGTAYHVRVLPVRALGKCGGYDSDVLAAMYWSAGLTIPVSLLAGAPPPNAHPARIINMSLGGVGACNAAYQQATRDITTAGVLIVASSGNAGGPVDTPANCPGVLGVAGLRHAGTKVGYSNLGTEVGLAAPAGNCVNIAPGTDCLFSLITTSNAGLRNAGTHNYTTPRNGNVGTSFSSPLAAAGAGLMLAVNPLLTPAKLIARLRETVRPFPAISDTTPQPPVCHVPGSGSDVQDLECICTTATCGAGMLDIGAAVVAAQRPTALATLHGTVGVGQTLTLDGSASAAATGRNIAAYAWTTVAATGGAGSATFSAPAASITTLLTPQAGSLTLRLTITDNFGATDTADVTIDAPTSGGATVTPSAPPATPPSASGGGGSSGLLWMAVLGAALARVTRLRSIRRDGRA
jgi:serine protease